MVAAIPNNENRQPRRLAGFMFISVRAWSWVEVARPSSSSSTCIRRANASVLGNSVQRAADDAETLPAEEKMSAKARVAGEDAREEVAWRRIHAALASIRFLSRRPRTGTSTPGPVSVLRGVQRLRTAVRPFDSQARNYRG